MKISYASRFLKQLPYYTNPSFVDENGLNKQSTQKHTSHSER